MWADTAGTIPATLHGEVARIDDKSGNGNHALQATLAQRPILRKDGSRYYLDFNGNRRMSVTSFDMSAADEVTICAGIFKRSDAGAAAVLELTANSAANVGGFWLLAPLSTGASGNFSFFCRGTSGSTPVNSVTATAPRSAVITGLGKISTDQMIIRRDGVQEGSVTANQGSGNFASSGLYIGSRAGTSLLFSGELYGLVIRGALTSGSDLTNLETFMTAQTSDPSLSLTQAYALGDSTVASHLGEPALMTLLGSGRQKITVAVPGNTIAQQEAAWVAQTITPSTVGWVTIQVGLNDLDPAEAASVAIARLQTLVNTVKTEVGSKPVLIAKMTPCRARLITLYGPTNGPIAYQKWLDMNEAIAGGGPNPITNVDGRVTAHEPLMNDGSGNLKAEYDPVDGIHPNEAGRTVNANAYVDALNALGIEP